jgi:hypothetical protein
MTRRELLALPLLTPPLQKKACLARGPVLKNLSRPKVEWGSNFWSSAPRRAKFARMWRL